MTAPIAERGRYRRVDRIATHDYSIVVRIIAAIAAAVPTIIGLIAVARVDWGNGAFDAAAVSSAGMTFTPVVALGTLVAGLLALVAACSWDRGSKLVMGALFVIAAIVIFAAHPSSRFVEVSDDMAWMYMIVGGVLILAGVVLSFTGSRRVVETEAL